MIRIIALLLALSIPQAKALVYYDFSGDCVEGCTGTIRASMWLFNTYTPGEPDIGYRDWPRMAITDWADIYPRIVSFSCGAPYGLPEISGSPRIVGCTWDTDARQGLITEYDNWSLGFFEDKFKGNNAVWTYRTTTIDEVPSPGTLALLSMVAIPLLRITRR